MSRRLISTFTIAVVLGVLYALGCSGSGTPESLTNPASPGLNSDQPLTELQQAADTPEYSLWGFWWAYVDPVENTWELVPARAPAMHFNIRELLEDGLPCTDCIKITGITQQPDDTVDIYIRLTHPLPDATYTGFDVRAIAMWNGSEYWPTSDLRTQDPESTDGYVLNADGYTNLFNPTDFPQGSNLNIFTYNQGRFATPTFPNSTLNPYIDYYSNENRHMFQAGDAVIRTWNIRYPSDQAFVLGYAVCASWEPPNTVPPVLVPDDFPITANQPEPYFISVTQTEPLAPFASSVADVEIQVWDWQNDPGNVWIECPDIWVGQKFSTSQLFDGESTLYTVPIDNDNLVDEGMFRALIGARDSTSGSPPWDFTNYRFFDIEVKDMTPYVNYPPVAAAEAEQYSVYTGDIVQFHSLSTDPNGPADITQYLWDFENDSLWDVDNTDPTHVYNTPGTYFVDHRVIDTYLEMDDLEPDEHVVITVTDPCCENPPVAVINGAVANILTKQELTLSSGSYDPDNNPPTAPCPVTVEWDIDGDGTFDGVTTNILLISWDFPGIYTVGLKATDACGLEDIDTIQVSVHVGVTLPENQAYKVPGSKYSYISNDYTVASAAPLGVDLNNTTGLWDFTGLTLSDLGNHVAILLGTHPEVASFSGDFPLGYDHFYKTHIMMTDGVSDTMYVAEEFATGPDRLLWNGVHEVIHYGSIPAPNPPPEFPFPLWIFSNYSYSFIWNLIFTIDGQLQGYGEGTVTVPYPGITNEPCVVIISEVSITLLGTVVLGMITYDWYLDDGTLVATVTAYNDAFLSGYDPSTLEITGIASFNALSQIGSY